MIDYNYFKELIKNHQHWFASLNKLDKILNCVSIESEPIGYGSELFDKLLNALFDEDGVDQISWWLCEKSINPSLKIYKDDKEIPSETIEDLWNLVKDNRK